MVVKKIYEEGVQAVVICPDWPSQPWYQSLMDITVDRMALPKDGILFVEDKLGPLPQREWTTLACLVDGRLACEDNDMSSEDLKDPEALSPDEGEGQPDHPKAKKLRRVPHNPHGLEEHVLEAIQFVDPNTSWDPESRTATVKPLDPFLHYTKCRAVIQQL